MSVKSQIQGRRTSVSTVLGIFGGLADSYYMAKWSASQKFYDMKLCVWSGLLSPLHFPCRVGHISWRKKPLLRHSGRQRTLLAWGKIPKQNLHEKKTLGKCLCHGLRGTYQYMSNRNFFIYRSLNSKSNINTLKDYLPWYAFAPFGTKADAFMLMRFKATPTLPLQLFTASIKWALWW